LIKLFLVACTNILKLPYKSASLYLAIPYSRTLTITVRPA